MPFIKDDQIGTPYDSVLKLDRDYPKQDHSALNVVGAAFRTENTIGSAVMHIKEQWGSSRETDVNFDPFEDDYMKGYEGYAKRFVHVKNKEHADGIKTSIDRENNDHKIIDDSGWGGTVAQVSAGILDPVTLAGFLAMPEVYVPGRIALSAGRMAVAGTADVAAREAVLNPTQETRTAEQSMFNIGAGAVLSGVLGGAAGKLTKSEYNKLLQDTTDHLADRPQGFASGGSAAVRNTTLEQEALSSAGGLEKLSVSPTMRLANSPVKSVRIAGQELGTDSLQRAKNVEGIATPASAELEVQKLHDGARYEVSQKIDEQVLHLKNSTPDVDALADELERVGQKVDRADVAANPQKYTAMDNFRALVSGALRNGDQSLIPQVANAAKTIRDGVFNPLKNEAIRLGLLPADVNVPGADSYLTRVWDTQQIINRRTEFKQRLSTWIAQSSPEVADEAGFMADDVINTLLGNGSGVNASVMADLVGKAGSLKARTLTIPDNMVADFLENDIEKIVDRYVRQMSSDIVLTRKFGSKNMDDTFSSIHSEYDDLMNAVRTEYTAAGKANKIDAEKERLERLRSRDVEDLTHLRDKIIGTAGKVDGSERLWARGAKSLRALTAVSRLGGMAISSLSDMARPIMVHGFSRYAKSLAVLATNPAMRKASTEEMKKFSVGLDLVLNSRFNALADLTDDFGRGTKFERGMDVISQRFSKATGMQHWNAGMKQISGIMTSDRVLEHVGKWGGLNKSDKAFLAKLGVDEDMAQRIAQQFEQHGKTESGLRLSNAEDWSDPVAREAFELGVLKASDFIINTPKAGTLPQFMNTWWGKTLMQFKSFLWASHEQTLLAGLQVGDSKFIQGSVGMIGLGALVTQSKAILAGREPSTDPTEILVNSIDSSGLLSMPFEINNMLDKIPNAPLSVNKLLNAGEAKRFAERGMGETLAGPALGYLFDEKRGAIATAGSAIGALAGTSEWDDKDTYKAQSLLPGQNLLGLRPYQLIFNTRETLDKINESFDQAFGSD